MLLISSKAGLSPSRQSIVVLMQEINFGRVERLAIRLGEPVLDHTVRAVREHKFGGENGPRAEIDLADYVLKQQVLELFTFFDRQQNGVIDVLEIKHGLPFRMTVTEVAA